MIKEIYLGWALTAISRHGSGRLKSYMTEDILERMLKYVVSST